MSHPERDKNCRRRRIQKLGCMHARSTRGVSSLSNSECWCGSNSQFLELSFKELSLGKTAYFRTVEISLPELVLTTRTMSTEARQVFPEREEKRLDFQCTNQRETRKGKRADGLTEFTACAFLNTASKHRLGKTERHTPFINTPPRPLEMFLFLGGCMHRQLACLPNRDVGLHELAFLTSKKEILGMTKTAALRPTEETRVKARKTNQYRQFRFTHKTPVVTAYLTRDANPTQVRGFFIPLST